MTGTTAQPAVTAEAARAAWSRFAAAWEDGDLAAIDELFAADLTYHVPPFPDLDRAGLRDFVAAFRAGFPEFGVDVHEDVVSGTTTVHRWSCRGVFSGRTPLLPVEPTGNTTTAVGALLFHWTDGTITEAWHFGDWMGWLTQAGVLPPLEAG